MASRLMDIFEVNWLSLMPSTIFGFLSVEPVNTNVSMKVGSWRFLA